MLWVAQVVHTVSADLHLCAGFLYALPHPGRHAPRVRLSTLLSEVGTRVRLFLLFGMVTHYALDVLFTEVSGRLPYLVSWETWQLVRSELGWR